MPQAECNLVKFKEYFTADKCLHDDDDDDDSCDDNNDVLSIRNIQFAIYSAYTLYPSGQKNVFLSSSQIWQAIVRVCCGLND